MEFPEGALRKAPRDLVIPKERPSLFRKDRHSTNHFTSLSKEMRKEGPLDLPQTSGGRVLS